MTVTELVVTSELAEEPWRLEAFERELRIFVVGCRARGVGS